MESYIQPLMDYLRIHPLEGMFFAFIIAFLESLPLLGTVFPGSVTMTAIGALIGSGVLPPVPTCLFAFLGALCGDCVGFWVGHRYHEKIRRLWPFKKFSKYLAYSETFFAKHGGKSIVIGRFVGPTRAAMPLIAGILRYTWKQFLPPAIFAAVLWSLIYIAPGIALGALAMEFSHAEMAKVLITGLGIIVLLWLLFWLLQFFFKRLTRTINHTIQKWWEWLYRHKSFFTQLIRNQQHPHDFHQLKLTLILFISTLLFLTIWFDVSHNGILYQLNEALFYFSQSFRGPGMDKFWAFFTVLGTPEALFISSILTASGLAAFKQWRTSTHFLLLGILSAGTVEFIKKLYFSARPIGLITINTTSSFPSGHTTLSVAILGFYAFATARIVSKQWRALIYAFFSLIILLISISRLSLGQHWFTDVIASWFLGLSLLIFSIISYRRMPKSHSRLKLSITRWFLLVLISTSLPWLATGWLTFQKTIDEAQFVWPSLILNFQQWRQNPTQWAPLYRQDRFGKIIEPFNVQWAGNLDDIQAYLLDTGWELVAKRSRVFMTLERFTSKEPEFNNPLLPRLYQNKPPEVFLIKHLPNSANILELRLWQSGITFSDTPTPLWLGVLTYHIPPEKLFLFPRYYIRLQSGEVLMNKESRLDHFTNQIIHIPHDKQPKNLRNQKWDGDVFIIWGQA